MRALGLSACLLQYFLEHLHVSVSAQRWPYSRSPAPALFLGPLAWGLLGVAPMSQSTLPASWLALPWRLPWAHPTSPTVPFWSRGQKTPRGQEPS